MPAAHHETSREYWSRLSGMAPTRGWLYRNAHYLVADVEIDPGAARRWVPRPLRLAEPATASIFTAWFPDTSFGSVYREVGLFLNVLHLGTPAVFCPWMLVDDDVALIVGRELLGYPKKLGEIAFEVDGNRVAGRANRRGAELVRMEGTLGDVVQNPPPMLGRPHRNVRTSMGLAVPTMIAFTPREEAIEVRRVELSLTVGRSDRDPVSELGFGRVLRALLHRVNLGASAPPIPIFPISPLWSARQWLLRAH